MTLFMDATNTCMWHKMLSCYDNMASYYMALSHKDWELPNSGICLAESDIDRGLDFPI